MRGKDMNTENIEEENNTDDEDFYMQIMFSDFEIIFDEDESKREIYPFNILRPKQMRIVRNFIHGDKFLNEHYFRFYFLDDHVINIELKCNEDEFENRIEEGFKDYRHKYAFHVGYKGKGNGFADLNSVVTLLNCGEKFDYPLLDSLLHINGGEVQWWYQKKSNTTTYRPRNTSINGCSYGHTVQD